jgi:dTDP-4-amino-4,6-dideoxygalactose transaminase
VLQGYDMSKESIADLALFGGPRLFSTPLHVGKPNVGNRERFLDRVRDILDRGWLTNNGPYVREFEAEIANRLGCRHCIAICNGTIALEIATRALCLKGEVIVPSFTFVATAHALQWQEITPVFCDIEPRQYTIDPEQVERMITPRTTAILGVHLWGRPCNVRALESIARRRNLKLVFDAAHAFGCSHDGTMVGNFGDAEVLSFHATKFLNTFEGGAITTNDDELASKIRLMKNFGFSGYDHVIFIGTNGKMSEVSAAMGLTGLERMEHFVETNRRNYHEYLRQLEKVPGLGVARYDEDEKHNYQYVIVEVEEETTGISRDDLVRVLHAEGVLARRYFFPGCHLMEPYRSYFPHATLLLPKTNLVASRVMSLPTGTAIGTAEVFKVCSLVRLAVENGRSITARMQGTRSEEIGV